MAPSDHAALILNTLLVTLYVGWSRFETDFGMGGTHGTKVVK